MMLSDLIFFLLMYVKMVSPALVGHDGQADNPLILRVHLRDDQTTVLAKEGSHGLESFWGGGIKE